VPQVVLALIGPADRLALIETGAVSMADRSELTGFGAVVAAAARETLVCGVDPRAGVTSAETGRWF
jgi:hypothetical protein